MQIQSMFFKQRASEKLDDAILQGNMRKAKGKFVDGRARAVAEFGVWEEVRTHAALVRDRALGEPRRLPGRVRDERHEARRRRALGGERRGGLPHHRRHRREERREEGHQVQVDGLGGGEPQRGLEAAGVQVVETDLGEYILQLAHQPPSHIVAPAVHMSKEQVADLFVAAHHKPRLTEIPAMAREAREALRGHFLTADMGISGSNFVIAETGTTLTVTNEGNADMVTTIPRIHVVITGIEKVIGTMEDFATLIRLLPRSAVGQTIANYLTLTTGLKMPGDADGPEQMHIVLVDAGRTKLVGSDLQEMLRCIRCGACMNHCPVYQNVGGHAYGWVYPGPMGSILTPVYVGLENAGDLPNAATFCGECAVACPVKIPLPDLMRKLREQQFDRKLRPWPERMAIAAWGFAATRPGLYALLAKIGARVARAGWAGARG